ncbi:arylsulfatase [Echinicola marina]|uniref:sulfatase family protein n=1 Tax=Echinicola marina TaxID=2859768 RepID=UPI001CF6B075|nr:arylsulfatase [Echinicola marina]UCS95472.1 arylsulfatase [Echinicola marina]
MNFNFARLLISALVISFFSCQNTSKEVGRHGTAPNIIYVLADDMGIGDVQAYNPEGKIKTPYLDQMAANGMRFTDAHTSSAVCTPTRYGILTGRYNWRSRLKNGVLGGYSEPLIDTARTTVASMLSDQGYHTAFIGKWHLSWNWGKDEAGKVDFSLPVTHNPNDKGFDYAYGHVASLDIPPYIYVENGKVTAVPTDSTESKDKYGWWRKGATSPDFDHLDVTPNFFRRGIAYVQERAKTGKPFFLYLPLPSPHTPILPSEAWQGKSGLNPYGDFVMMVDDYMGKLLAAVKEAGIEDNTLIIFTSDNGCSPAAKIDELIAEGHYPSGTYRGHKADIYEGGHRVPFIVKWPKVIQAGSVNDQTICTTDLMATCADLVNYTLKDNEGEDSYSMLPLLEGKEQKGGFREATVHHSINGSFAIRQGDWKLAMTAGSGGWSYPTPKEVETMDSIPPVQLFNLKDDPSERTNLQAEHPEKVAELQALLTKYIEDGRSTPGAPQSNEGEKVWKQLWWMK